MMVPAYSFAAILAIACCAGDAAAAALAPHRAVYEIRLLHAADRSGIEAIKGRMVFDFTGSACKGYTTRFRFVMAVQAGDERRLTDQQTMTRESGDGKEFRFSTRNFVNGDPDKEVEGRAAVGETGITVDIERPQKARYELPAALLPTRHLLDLIDRAQRGESFYEAPIFDGSDDANQILATSVFIGKPAGLEEGDPEARVLVPLGPQATAWPVSISYFEASGGAGDSVPLYHVEMKLYPNGVTRDLVMDYGDYTLAARLSELTVLDPPADCP